MTKKIFSFSSTSGLTITIEKRHYFEVWVDYPKNNFLLSKVMRTDDEGKARLYVDAMIKATEITHN